MQYGLQDVGDSNPTAQLPMTAADSEWRQPEAMRAGEVGLLKPFVSEKIISDSQMSDIELFTWLRVFSLCFNLIIAVLWFLPFRIRKYIFFFSDLFFDTGFLCLTALALLGFALSPRLI